MLLDRIKAQRRELARRRWWIIYNNDGDDIGFIKPPATTKAFLDQRTTAAVVAESDLTIDQVRLDVLYQ